MSIKIMAAAWQVEADATDKLVLLALADRADDDGRCWPGIATLAAKCSLSERSVQRAIQALSKAGHLTRKEVAGKGCIYHVHPRHSVTPDRLSPVTNTTETPDTVSPNTSRYIIKRERDKPPLSTREAKSKFELPAWVPADAWAGFERMRKAAKKPLTDRARDLAIRKLWALAAKGHPPGDVLDQSTMNNWQGLFPIKETGNGNSVGRNRGNGAGAYRRQPGWDGLKQLAAEADPERWHDLETDFGGGA